MTIRDLTREELEEIPIYLAEPFFSTKDNLYFTYWDNKSVWSTTGKNPWNFDNNKEYILDQDFEEHFPEYSQLTDVLANNKTFTAQYKGSDIRWSFKHKQWRYRNHKPVNLEEDLLVSEDEQAEVS